MARRAASVLGAGLLLGACGGDAEPTVTRAELPRVVLQPADLPRVWVRFDEGRQIGPDSPPPPRADRTRFGRIEGWKARNGRSSRNPVQPGRNPICEQSDVMIQEYSSTPSTPGQQTPKPEDRLFDVTPCPADTGP